LEEAERVQPTAIAKDVQVLIQFLQVRQPLHLQVEVEVVLMQEVVEDPLQ
jgi:hypothetical protein